MSWPKVMAVIRSDEDPFGISVIEDGSRSRSREIGSERMLYGAGVRTMGIAKPRTDEVEIVDAVVQNFQARRGRKKSPYMPWCAGARMNLHIVNIAKKSVRGKRLCSKIVRCIAQRK